MKRFEINVGDDFPVDENGQPRGCGGRRRYGALGRFGTVARVLFVLALAVIIVRHPVHSALILGLLLLAERFTHLRRNGRTWHGPWRRWRSAAERGAFV